MDPDSFASPSDRESGVLQRQGGNKCGLLLCPTTPTNASVSCPYQAAHACSKAVLREAFCSSCPVLHGPAWQSPSPRGLAHQAVVVPDEQPGAAAHRAPKESPEQEPVEEVGEERPSRAASSTSAAGHGQATGTPHSRGLMKVTSSKMHRQSSSDDAVVCR